MKTDNMFSSQGPDSLAIIMSESDNSAADAAPTDSYVRFIGNLELVAGLSELDSLLSVSDEWPMAAAQADANAHCTTELEAVADLPELGLYLSESASLGSIALSTLALAPWWSST